MTSGWDGKEHRRTAPTRALRRRYRWNRLLDSLVEERVLLAVALVAVFTILAVLAMGVSSINARAEAREARTRAQVEKTDQFVRCAVGAFQAADRETARAVLARCLQN